MLRDVTTSRTLSAAIVAAAMLVPCAPLAAQSPVEAEPTVWLTYAGEHAIARGELMAEWRQRLLRTGEQRFFTGDAAGAAGAAGDRTVAWRGRHQARATTPLPGALGGRARVRRIT